MYPHIDEERSYEHSPLHRALMSLDFSYVKSYLDGSFKLDIAQAHVVAITCKALDWVNEHQTAPSDWRMWIKNRLDELGYFQPGYSHPLRIDIPVTLHIFFLGINETEEELFRLRTKMSKEEAETLDEFYTIDEDQPRLSTPGIERTQVILQPIDRVAARVVGNDK